MVQGGAPNNSINSRAEEVEFLDGLTNMTSQMKTSSIQTVMSKRLLSNNLDHLDGQTKFQCHQ